MLPRLEEGLLMDNKRLGSRGEEAAAFVKGEKVFVDHESVTKPGRDVKAGDIVSVRSKGRFVVDSVDGSTKKGNLKITVRRFS